MDNCGVECEVAEALAEALTDSDSDDDGSFGWYGDTKLVYINPDPAFLQDVCIAKVRSNVGGVVVVGRFRIVQPPNLLDLSYFGRTFYSDSTFSPERREIITRAFLRELQETLSRPVTPSDEPLEYVPTQLSLNSLHAG